MSKLKVVSFEDRSIKASNKKKVVSLGACSFYFLTNGLFTFATKLEASILAQVNTVLCFATCFIIAKMGRDNGITASLLVYSLYVLAVDSVVQPVTIFQYFIETVLFFTFVFCFSLKKSIR